MAAVAIVAVLSVGWDLNAAVSSSAIQAARQAPAEQTVLRVEGMT